MKKLLFLLLFPLLLSAQLKGEVFDAETKKPIPYVNIWVEGEKIGTNSEENGSFVLNISEEKNIVFSALGYITKTISLKEITKVYLQPTSIQLDELVLEKPKGTEELIVGDYRKIKLNSGVTNTGQNNVHIWGKIIIPSEKILLHPYIKTITFRTRSSVKEAKLRLRFFEYSETKEKLEEITQESIIVNIKKGKNDNIVEIESYNIKIPESGIVIGFEYLKIEQNKYDYIYTEQGKKGKHKGFRYEPSILGFLGNKKSLMILNPDGTIRSDYGNVEIAIKITLSN